MILLKSACHHWWPRCVSAHWAAEDGTTGWIKPDSTCIRLPPKQLGQIGNAHHIKLGKKRGDATTWDTSFEGEFDRADGNFPSVISWLQSLQSEFRSDLGLRDRFLPQPAENDQLRLLTECVVSLAVRSPMNREASVSIVERLRGTISGPERDALIGLNMRNSQRLIADAIGERAKFAVLISREREFNFGDGFFHNVKAVTSRPPGPKILAPITPNLSVIISRPVAFRVEPRLSTIVLSERETECCNHAVQVYSRQAIFFRSQQPTVGHDFACGQHREFATSDNPVENLIGSIPGISQQQQDVA